MQVLDQPPRVAGVLFPIADSCRLGTYYACCSLSRLWAASQIASTTRIAGQRPRKFFRLPTEVKKTFLVGSDFYVAAHFRSESTFLRHFALETKFGCRACTSMENFRTGETLSPCLGHWRGWAHPSLIWWVVRLGPRHPGSMFTVASNDWSLRLLMWTGTASGSCP